MATASHSTSRRGVIGAVAALPVIALSLTSAATAAPQADKALAVTLAEVRDLIEFAAQKQDEMLRAGVHHQKAQAQTSWIAWEDAKFAYEVAIEDILMLRDYL